MRIAVAMCVTAARPALDICLEALRAEVGDALVVEGPTLAAARNDALVAASDAEVLALVEGDTLIGAGWANALHDAWRDAPADVAVQGGSIRLRLLGARPRWLTPALEAAVGGVWDGGVEVRDVDLRHITFHGANVSFRAPALRGAGGFWPARGHPGARDWFGAEHHAQQGLAATGWRGRYVPALGVERAIPPGEPRRADLLRARLRYGARDSAVGRRRPTSVALRGIVRGLAGAVVGGERAIERLARAAENAGALAGPLLVHGDFQPTASSTPFRASVPPPAPGPLAARRTRPRPPRGARILLYHRIGHPVADPLGLAVAPARFSEHLDVLRSEWRLMPFPELVEAGRRGCMPDRAVGVTFDDGYADNLREALPRLEAAGVPATIFVATEGLDTGRGWWWDELDRILRAAPAGADLLELRVGGQRRRWPTATAGQRAGTRALVHAWLQPQHPDTIARALADLRAWAELDEVASAPTDADRPLTPSELRRLAAHPLMTIGAHTRRHASLARRSADDQERDIAAGRADLAAWLQAEPEHLAYPFGVPGTDVDATTLGIVGRAGFRAAVTSAPGVLRSDDDPFLLARAPVPDARGEAFARWLSELR